MRRLTAVLQRLVVSPLLIPAGAALGLVFAKVFPRTVPVLSEIGAGYLAALQLCVLPLVALAITANLARLLEARELPGSRILRILLVFITSCVVASSLGLLIGNVAGLGTGVPPMEPAIAPALQPSATVSANAPEGAFTTSKIIPQNIFAAFASGNHLAVLFMALFAGLALGSTVHEGKLTMLSVLDVLYAMFMKILTWLIYLLPLGVLCLVARNLSPILSDHAQLGALAKFVTVCVTASAILAAAFMFGMSALLDRSVAETVRMVRRAVVVAFCSTSSSAAMPLMLERLSAEPKMQRSLTLTLIPLGVNLHPFGSVLYFGMAAIFTVQLQAVELQLSSYLMLALGAVAAGMAAGGIPGPAPIIILTYVLQPFDIPTEIGITALVAINSFVDPFITVLNVLGNYLATAILARRPSLSLSQLAS